MHSPRLNYVVIYAVLMLAVIYIQNSNGQVGRGNNRRGQRPRHGGRRTGGMHPDIHQAYLDVYQQRPTTERSPMWAALIPNLPDENEVECYVEFMSVQSRGGRCIQLGGNTTRPYICQSGEQIEFSPYCQYMAQQQQQQQQELYQEG